MLLDKYYKILQVDADCNDQQLKKAYHKLAKTTHPDRMNILAQQFNSRAPFHVVQEAYHQLVKARKIKSNILKKYCPQLSRKADKKKTFKNILQESQDIYTSHLKLLDTLNQKLKAMRSNRSIQEPNVYNIFFNFCLLDIKCSKFQREIAENAAIKKDYYIPNLINNLEYSRVFLTKLTKIYYFVKINMFRSDKIQCDISVICQYLMQSLTPRKRNPITDRIRNNIHELVSLLHTDQNQIVTISSSSSLAANLKENYQLQVLLPQIKRFIEQMFNPYECTPLMSQILKKNIILEDNQPLFDYTIFHNKLKPALALYLYQETPFLYMRGENSHKIIDVFYKFLLFEENSMIENQLYAPKKNLSIGEWFKQQGLYKMFHGYYSDFKSFTIFLGNFMCFGIAYMFISAVALMKGYTKVIKKQQVNLQRLQFIQVGYIKKYKLTDKQRNKQS